MKKLNVHKMLFLGSLLFATVHVSAQEAPIMQLLNEMADKPENHQAIASYYRTMAAEARAEADMHKTMKDTYTHSHAQVKGQAAGRMTGRHSDCLIELSLSAAEEYERLAALHEPGEAAQ